MANLGGMLLSWPIQTVSRLIGDNWASMITTVSAEVERASNRSHRCQESVSSLLNTIIEGKASKVSTIRCHLKQKQDLSNYPWVSFMDWSPTSKSINSWAHRPLKSRIFYTLDLQNLLIGSAMNTVSDIFYARCSVLNHSIISIDHLRPYWSERLHWSTLSLQGNVRRKRFLLNGHTDHRLSSSLSSCHCETNKCGCWIACLGWIQLALLVKFEWYCRSPVSSTEIKKLLCWIAERASLETSYGSSFSCEAIWQHSSDDLLYSSSCNGIIIIPKLSKH